MKKGKIVLVALLTAMMVVLISYLAYAETTNVNANTRSNSAIPTPPGVWKPLSVKGPRLAWKFIEVSPEYNSTVIKILQSSEDVSKLLGEGYRIASIRPLIKAYVSGNGDVTLKATEALVVLTNNSSVYVYKVDISNGTVTLLFYINKAAIQGSGWSMPLGKCRCRSS